MLVKATSKPQELTIVIPEANYEIPKEGDTFEVSEERYKALCENSWGETLVVPVEEKPKRTRRVKE